MDLPAAADWQQYKNTITVPANAVSVSILHLIFSVGWLETDNFSLAEHTIDINSTFSQGMVSLTFDDGWLNQYTNAVPILNSAGIDGTFYIVTADTIDAGNGGNDLFITPAQLRTMQSAGHEIGNHTQTHPHLPTLSAAQATAEISGAKNELLAMGLNPVDTLAYPYGEYNQSVETIVANTGHIAARSVDRGFNDKTTDLYALKIQQVDRTTTVADVQAWIDTANESHTWLILMFHDIDNAPDEYGTTPAILSGIADYLNSSGTKTVTMDEGMAYMP